MKNKNIKHWIEQYRWAVDNRQLLPCSVSFVAGGVLVIAPNEQTAKELKELPAVGLVVTIKTK